MGIQSEPVPADRKGMYDLQARCKHAVRAQRLSGIVFTHRRKVQSVMSDTKLTMRLMRSSTISSDWVSDSAGFDTDEGLAVVYGFARASRFEPLRTAIRGDANPRTQALAQLRSEELAEQYIDLSGVDVLVFEGDSAPSRILDTAFLHRLNVLTGWKTLALGIPTTRVLLVASGLQDASALARLALVCCVMHAEAQASALLEDLLFARNGRVLGVGQLAGLALG